MVPRRVDVVVAPDSLHYTRSGAVTGRIHLRCVAADGAIREYPEADWNDFPVPVLAWWLDELSRAADGGGTCRFMEGPHEFTLTPAGAHLLRLRAGGGVWEVAAADFEASLRRAAALTLAECERRGWSSRDVFELRRAAGRPTHYPAD